MYVVLNVLDNYLPNDIFVLQRANETIKLLFDRHKLFSVRT